MGHTVDTRGLFCPVPIVRTGARLLRVAAGTEIEILATDPGIVEDMPAYCRANGHTYVGHREDGEVYRIRIRKGDLRG